MLRHTGHEVLYVGSEYGLSGDYLKGNIENQGFFYITINFYTQKYQKEDTKHSEAEMIQNYLFNLSDKNIFSQIIGTHEPDLFILDIHLPALGIALYKYNIPIIFGSAFFYTDKSDLIPPLTSSIIPKAQKNKTEYIRKNWDKYLAEKVINPMLENALNYLGKMHNFPLNNFMYKAKSIAPFGLRFPEIIFWPKELDFPIPSRELKNKFYLGGLVDIKRRRQQDFQFPQTEKPIVYCMLGTRSKHANDKKNQFLRALIHRCTKIEQYFFVFSLGRYLNPSDFPDLPNHILLASYIPQIEVLQKATIMINHAGGDSIKECIRFAVPMICFPFSDDQFGNGARMAYHQLAIVKPFQQEELKNLDQMLEELLQNEVYGQNLQKFQQLFIENEQSDYAVKVIESFLEK